MEVDGGEGAGGGSVSTLHSQRVMQERATLRCPPVLLRMRSCARPCMCVAVRAYAGIAEAEPSIHERLYRWLCHSLFALPFGLSHSVKLISLAAALNHCSFFLLHIFFPSSPRWGHLLRAPPLFVFKPLPSVWSLHLTTDNCAYGAKQETKRGLCHRHQMSPTITLALCLHRGLSGDTVTDYLSALVPWWII